MYKNVNSIDLWVGGIAEDHVRGSELGPTFEKIFINQFTRIRDGDRFWYQRILSKKVVFFNDIIKGLVALSMYFACILHTLSQQKFSFAIFMGSIKTVALSRPALLIASFFKVLTV